MFEVPSEDIVHLVHTGYSDVQGVHSGFSGDGVFSIRKRANLPASFETGCATKSRYSGILLTLLIFPPEILARNLIQTLIICIFERSIIASSTHFTHS